LVLWVRGVDGVSIEQRNGCGGGNVVVWNVLMGGGTRGKRRSGGLKQENGEQR